MVLHAYSSVCPLLNILTHRRPDYIQGRRCIVMVLVFLRVLVNTLLSSMLRCMYNKFCFIIDSSSPYNLLPSFDIRKNPLSRAGSKL
jgi:hypothetical protein